MLCINKNTWLNNTDKLMQLRIYRENHLRVPLFNSFHNSLYSGYASKNDYATWDAKELWWNTEKQR